MLNKHQTLPIVYTQGLTVAMKLLYMITVRVPKFWHTCYTWASKVLYPAIFWGCCFFDEYSEEKNCYAAGESVVTVSSPQWGPEVKSWKILAILHSK